MPVRRQLRLAGRDEVVELRATLAPPPAKSGVLLLWLFDISDAEAERASLARRLKQAEGALDALSHLIESAPFPMWYCGPDQPGLVNAAFVAAVEGRDAADVIEREASLSTQSAQRARWPVRARRWRPANPIRARNRRRSAKNGECCAWSTSHCPPAR